MGRKKAKHTHRVALTSSPRNQQASMQSGRAKTIAGAGGCSWCTIEFGVSVVLQGVPKPEKARSKGKRKKMGREEGVGGGDASVHTKLPILVVGKQKPLVGLLLRGLASGNHACRRCMHGRPRPSAWLMPAVARQNPTGRVPPEQQRLRSAHSREERAEGQCAARIHPHPLL